MKAMSYLGAFLDRCHRHAWFSKRNTKRLCTSNSASDGSISFFWCSCHVLHRIDTVDVCLFIRAEDRNWLGFITCFIINIIACFLDMILRIHRMCFPKLRLTSMQPVATGTIIDYSKQGFAWIVCVALFPSVNFQTLLCTIFVLRSSTECMSVCELDWCSRSYSFEWKSWMSVRDPGLGGQLHHLLRRKPSILVDHLDCWSRIVPEIKSGLPTLL